MDSSLIMFVVVLGAVVLAYVLLRGKNQIPSPEISSKPSRPVPPKAQPAAAPAPSIEPGIPPEVVAVIAASVCAMSGGQYTLRAVRRASRATWARAGAVDVTAPF